MKSKPLKILAVVFLVSFLVCSLVLNFSLITIKGLKGLSPNSPKESFGEEFVEGNRGSANKIVVIDLVGMITSEERAGEGMMQNILKSLKAARDDERVKAVILKINTPGGEVTASDIIYHAVKETKKEKPVIAFMESVAASGGYYVAMGASYIVAHELTITGSIGVIMQSMNVQNLLNKIGVQALIFKSGKMKDLMNPTRPMTEEEKEFVQNMVQETYQKFFSVVKEGRGMSTRKLKKLADGRVFSGERAKKLNLVDGLGYFADAIEKAKEIAKIDDACVVRYEKRVDISRLLRLFSGGSGFSTKLEVFPDRYRMQSGNLYYLSPHFLGQK